MNNKRYLVGLTVLAIAVLVLGLSGCKQVAEKAIEGAIEKTTGVDVDAGDGSVTYEAEDGSTVEITGEQSDVPEGFPDDFPVYDADIENSSKISSGEGTGFYVGLVTTDAYDDVFEWYTSKLAEEGWEILAELNTQNDGVKSGVVTVSKGTSEGGVTFAEDGDVTRIAISINIK
ncbi:MAG: hypothetical protein U1F44_06735 [Coriobacteriia bacterium]|nr:hypothetical protein [Coriobacteriia bacterium]